MAAVSNSNDSSCQEAKIIQAQEARLDALASAPAPSEQFSSYFEEDEDSDGSLTAMMDDVDLSGTAKGLPLHLLCL